MRWRCVCEIWVRFLFVARRRVEFGRMASLFLDRKLQTLFYLMMIVYLYGDLAIYAVAVPDTLAKFSGPIDLGGGIVFSAGEVYYFYLTIFALVVVPFCFFNFSVRSCDFGVLIAVFLTILTRHLFAILCFLTGGAAIMLKCFFWQFTLHDVFGG